ncbi:MAG: potassium transporter TrkA [Bacteroidetes bacterium HGW-Bacteroidetes-16]|jgi:trk system potassium uptake protein TrkA|nr:MAG: potassium transporter TrkA [Bacteroidetes bacterium HGW-Bacteroidetes-16]
MKFIIFGLGNFGASLAQKLTERGHEVIGIDHSMSKVDAFKEKISHTICLDATDQYTVPGLPLKDTDVVIVAIGENEGDNIMVTALLKNLNVKRLIGRALNPLHENVLNAIGVDEIVHPEEETAERWAKKLCLVGLIDSFKLDNNFSMVETNVPKNLEGKSIGEIDFRRKYNLLILTTIKNTQHKGILGLNRNVTEVQGVASPEVVLEANDVLVLFGANQDIQSFLKEKR